MAFLQTGPNLAPMVIVPLVGASLDRGYGTAAFVLLGIFVALAGLTNLRPATPQANSTSDRT
jgi:hypothetical protein